MNPLLLLALGLSIVLGGILWLRLHPFLSLILGAFAVGGLTSIDNLEKAMTAKYHGESVRKAINEGVKNRIAELKKKGEKFDAKTIRKEVRRNLEEKDKELKSTAQAKAEDYRKNNNTLKRITTAFGGTCAKIGILIAMACVIGRCMLAAGPCH